MSCLTNVSQSAGNGIRPKRKGRRLNDVSQLPANGLSSPICFVERIWIAYYFGIKVARQDVQQVHCRVLSRVLCTVVLSKKDLNSAEKPSFDRSVIQQGLIKFSMNEPVEEHYMAG